MDSDRKTGIVVGALFIVATVASILGSVALGSALDGPDYLINVAAHESQVILAVLLFLIAASSAFATAFLLFPILRRHSEGLAAGYVGIRGFENVFYVAGVVGLLIMLTVSQTDAVGTAGALDLPLLGAALLALHDWSVLIGTLIFFALGSLTLNYVLYQSGLVPRWLSLWGIVGAVLVFSYGLLGIFGVDTGLGSPFMLLAMPIALQEMVFAVWLIAKGFNRPTVQLDQSLAHRVEMMS
ncbi:MAG: DUF4386 domain-containing protein [Acidimicrobiia bacterium]